MKLKNPLLFSLGFLLGAGSAEGGQQPPKKPNTPPPKPGKGKMTPKQKKTLAIIVSLSYLGLFLIVQAYLRSRGTPLAPFPTMIIVFPPFILLSMALKKDPPR